MQIESGSNQKINFTSEAFPPSFSEHVRGWINNNECFFYADTSKTTGKLKIYPPTFEQVNLEDEEKRIDKFLFNHWSLYANPVQHWPRLHTTLDPKANQIYRIVEFPVVVDAKEYLSIKQSVRQRGRLIALSYRLAELEDSR